MPDGRLTAGLIRSVWADSVQTKSLRRRRQGRPKTGDDQQRATLQMGLAESLIDLLTRLRNRRCTIHTLNPIMHQSHFYRRGFSLLLADLDHFKATNDQFGRATGKSGAV